MATDPVCKMQVDEKKAAATSEYQRKDVLLLRADLQDEVRKNPEQYAK